MSEDLAQEGVVNTHYLSDGTELMTISMVINPTLGRHDRLVAISEGLRTVLDLIIDEQAEEDTFDSAYLN